MFFPQPPKEGFTGGPENTLSGEASRAQAPDAGDYFFPNSLSNSALALSTSPVLGGV